MTMTDRQVERVTSTEISQHQFARKLFLALEVLRGLDPNLPITFAQVFLLIAQARDGEIVLRDLTKMADFSASAVNRAVTYLGERHWKDPDRPGLGLVDSRPDIRDRRQRIITLSAKGRRAASQMKELIYG